MNGVSKQITTFFLFHLPKQNTCKYVFRPVPILAVEFYFKPMIIICHVSQQALNGFLMILDCNGELFFATHTIETYLGFHQSDVIHQSVYELVHSEDREELQRQLGWNSFMGTGADNANLSLQELLSPEHNHLLDRSFTVRFRCLLDNTSGFLVRVFLCIF